MDLVGCELFFLLDLLLVLFCFVVFVLVFLGLLLFFVEVFLNRDDVVDVFGGKLILGVVDGLLKRDFVCVLVFVFGGVNLMGVVFGF